MRLFSFLLSFFSHREYFSQQLDVIRLMPINIFSDPVLDTCIMVVDYFFGSQ